MIPIESFHRLAEEELADSEKIDRKSEDLTLLFGTGRCGSTLIANIVDQADPDCLVLSEPVPFINLYLYHKRVPPEEFRQLLRSSLRMLCKPCPGKKRYFFKPVCFTLPMAREIRRLLPRTRQLYCYRDPLKTTWAHERAFAVTPGYQSYRWFHWFHALPVFEELSGLHPNYRLDVVGYEHLTRCNIWEVCFMMWAFHHMTYREQAKEFDFPRISYDDIFKDRVAFCRNALELSGYDVEGNLGMLEGGMKALDRDSQEGRTICQRQLQGYPLTEVSAIRIE